MASIFAPNLFRGRTAMVSGGGSGIGFAIAAELSRLGADVVLASRDTAKLERAAAALHSEGGGSISTRTADIRDEDAVRALMRSVPSLDILVNNGGGQFPSAAADMSSKGWRAVVETNLTGTFQMCREAFTQHFDAARGGAVVNITADSFTGFPGMAHTGAARAGVDNLTKTLAVEWASRGVRVNAVAPGVIYSPTAAANYAGVAPKLFEEARKGIPAGRCGTPAEVASAVAWLCSPGASFVSGAVLRVDGGSSLYTRGLYDVPPHDNWPEAPLPPVEAPGS